MNTVVHFVNVLQRWSDGLGGIGQCLTSTVLLLVRMTLRDSQQLNAVVWFTVIFNSTMTSSNYLTLLWQTRSTIKREIRIWPSAAIMGLGFISSLLLVNTILLAFDDITEANFGFTLTILFIFTAVARGLHCYLGILFFAFVGPMSEAWVTSHAPAARTHLRSMIYCKIFLYLHWLIITFTYNEYNLSTLILHIFSLLYRTVGLFWIIWLTAHLTGRTLLKEMWAACPTAETGCSVLKGAFVAGTIVGVFDIATKTLAGSEIVFPQWSLYVPR